MTKHKSYARPAMTAIAAVLAFSSTPLFAQDAAPVDAPSPVSISSTPAPAAPAAPEVTAPAVDAPDTPETAITAAPTPTGSMTADETTTRAAPRVKATPKPAKVSVSKAPATKSIEPTTSATSKAEVLLDKQVALTAAPPVAASAAVAPAVPVEAKAAEPVTKAETPNDALPIAAGAGAAILALAGAGIALRRRRHDEDGDEALVAADTDYVEPIPVAAVQPAVIAVTPKAYVPTIDPGDHSLRVAAAHAGPSEDNPSLSLKKRVKRAHALDLMEKNGHIVPPPARSMAQPTKASVSTWAAPAKGLMFGQPRMTPAFSN